MITGSKKTPFTLFFGNRGFFTASLIASARDEMIWSLKALGHECIVLDANATRPGAAELSSAAPGADQSIACGY